MMRKSSLLRKGWAVAAAFAMAFLTVASPMTLTAEAANVRVPTASGTTTYENGKVLVDASNISQGYVMIRYSGGKERIKVQITKGAVTYTYDLNARDAYEVFPFSEGDGTYSVKVFENVSGNQYAQIFSKDLSVSMADQFLPFLYPNQYVNFSEGNAAVQKGAEVAAGAADEIGIVTNVFHFVVDNLTYDVAKAQSVQSGYLPNIDAVLAARTGICFDYAALMTAMLRTQNIPTKLVVGYTGSAYHAWVNVYITNVGWVDNAIYFDGQQWSLMDPTFMSSGGKSEQIRKYIGNASNYQAKYSY
ncbi:MAG: transglutaminase domain-containing protein [Lachnospiraceae bacterium]|nr:transglutaminase domain-containing protein [Lachnospiraceae bacterium]